MTLNPMIAGAKRKGKRKAPGTGEKGLGSSTKAEVANRSGD